MIQLPPLEEIVFRTSRSGGPGGQNVNKVETRVEAVWNMETSAALTGAQRERLRAALARRIHEDKTIRVVSRTERTQLGNRKAAVARLRALVAAALAPRRRRRATVKTRASEEDRLQAKRRRSALKRSRTGRPEATE
ncbi:MAG: alternative ribosome rescue aminoacyl-tRNA hydrolase ArfB [Bacteroidota bacterium]